MTTLQHNEERSNEREMVRYLLGQMAEEERTHFEARYFADDEMFEELRQVKAELFDAHPRGHLPTDERAQLEQQYATPAGREQLAFAHALRQALHESATPRRAWWQFDWQLDWRWGLMAAALLLVSLGSLGWLWFENRRLHSELARVQTEQAESARRAAALQQELAQLRAQPTPVITPPAPRPSVAPQLKPAALPALVLLPIGRANGVTEVRVPAGAQRLPLQLTLNFDPGAQPCTADLRVTNGAAFNHTASLRAHDTGAGLIVTWIINTAALNTAEYEVTLTGKDTSQQAHQATYRFRVTR